MAENKKIKAGMLLSKYLKDISNEETEFLTVQGEDKMATKAEALARLMWKMALGYTEKKILDGVVAKEIVHSPDKAMIGLIWDRTEGKAPLMHDDKQGKQTIADKVSAEGKKRIAKAGNLDGHNES